MIISRTQLEQWFVDASGLSRKTSSYKDELEYIKRQTSFLPEDARLTQRIWHLIHSTTSRPTCKNCDNFVNWDNRNRKYRTFCSRRTCRDNDPDLRIKKAEKNKIRKSRNCTAHLPIIITTLLDDCKRELYETGILTHKGINPQYKRRLNQYPTLAEKIIKATSYLLPSSPTRQRLHCINQGLNHVPVCRKKGCNNECFFHFDGKQAGKFSEYCSASCSQTCEERINKIKDTKLKTYGDEFYNNRKKARISYGNVFNIPIESLSKLEDSNWLHAQHHVHEKSINHIAYDLKVSPTAVQGRFKKFGIQTKHFPYSTHEKQLIDFIKDLLPDNVDILTNKRNVIPPYEIDVFVPSCNLAIEMNGIYWHSEANGKGKNYHLNKLKACAQKNIRLLQITDIQWEEKNRIVKSMIKHRLGYTEDVVAGRKTKVRIIDNSACDKFLNDNHIQGSCKSSIKIGLFFNEELVSCMTFSKPRYATNIEYELIRYATKCNMLVVGGASKLFSYFLTQYNPLSIVSYSNKERSVGNIYKVLGFEYSHTSKPGYCYVKGNKVYSRVQFQKHKLSSLLPDFKPDLTEKENMNNHGYHRLWDCGNDVWLWKKQ